MTPLTLSKAAKTDLRSILSYGTAEFGVDAADAYYFSLDDAFDRLRAFPQAGQVDEETGLGLRRWHHKRHRIFYRYDGKIILIVRILHFAVDLEGRFAGA